ncbi:MAG: hypothetical protein H6677_04580 [Candidatus Obscuribacterales bacterium]|nr:hypothetical protein [Cyanobacteria bacterium HKST-UBA01]MCB9467533.1 hypothetical protein [Candidatus Obscuribacterales bacterium]
MSNIDEFMQEKLTLKDFDRFFDIYSEYLDLYDAGMDPEAILPRIMTEFEDDFTDEFDRLPTHLGLLAAMYDIGVDTTAIGKEVKAIFAEISKDKGFCGEPKKNYADAIKLLRKPNPSPRPRLARVYRLAAFDCGDCLSLQFSDGSYGAALVVGREDEIGVNLIVPLRYRSFEKPTQEVFENRDYIVLPRSLPDGTSYERKPYVWYNAQTFPEVQERVELVCIIEITAEDFVDHGRFAGDWNSLWMYVEEALPSASQ